VLPLACQLAFAMFDTTVQLLIPHFETESGRRMLLTMAFNACPDVLAKVDYSGSAIEFTPRLIHMLQAHGDIPAGIQALWCLLLTLKSFVGAEMQNQIGLLEIYANTATAVVSTETAFRVKITKPVFISYSLANREFAEILHTELTALGFQVWQDIHDLEIGEDWWRQITETLNSCHTMVLCLSPQALMSLAVKQEWHKARQFGVRVMPILAEDVDFSTVPRWMRRVDWADFRAGKPDRDATWHRFLYQLNSEYEPRQVPFMVDVLPSDFVSRPDDIEPVIQTLIAGTHDGTALKVALKGAAGSGKTMLTRALCHDTRVRGTFDDGILWVSLSERVSESDLIACMLDLIVTLSGKRPNVITREGAHNELKKAVGDRFILIVVDDVWRAGHLQPFIDLGSNCATLISTRNSGVLPTRTISYQIDAMQTHEAVQLLSAEIADAAVYENTLITLTDRLGRWPLLLKLSNGQIRKRITQKQSVKQALEWVGQALDRKGLSAFDDPNDPDARNRAVVASLEVSLELLNRTQRTWFERLAIYPEDVEIPLVTLEKQWHVDAFEVEELAGRLAELSLLIVFDLSTRFLRLHDIVRRYLRESHKADLTAWNQEFLDGYHVGEWHELPLDEPYLWHWLGYHLQASGHQDTFHRLLIGSPRWMLAKFIATGSHRAFIGDLELAIADFPAEYHPDHMPLLLSFYIARQVIYEQAIGYTDRDLQTLVWVTRFPEAIGHASLRSNKKGFQRCIGMLAIHGAMPTADVRRAKLLDSIEAEALQIVSPWRQVDVLVQVAEIRLRENGVTPKPLLRRIEKHIHLISYPLSVLFSDPAFVELQFAPSEYKPVHRLRVMKRLAAIWHSVDPSERDRLYAEIRGAAEQMVNQAHHLWDNDAAPKEVLWRYIGGILDQWRETLVDAGRSESPQTQLLLTALLTQVNNLKGWVSQDEPRLLAMLRRTAIGLAKAEQVDSAIEILQTIENLWTRIPIIRAVFQVFLVHKQIEAAERLIIETGSPYHQAVMLGELANALYVNSPDQAVSVLQNAIVKAQATLFAGSRADVMIKLIPIAARLGQDFQALQEATAEAASEIGNGARRMKTMRRLVEQLSRVKEFSTAELLAREKINYPFQKSLALRSVASELAHDNPNHVNERAIHLLEEGHKIIMGSKLDVVQLQIHVLLALLRVIPADHPRSQHLIQRISTLRKQTESLLDDGLMEWLLKSGKIDAALLYYSTNTTNEDETRRLMILKYLLIDQRMDDALPIAQDSALLIAEDIVEVFNPVEVVAESLLWQNFRVKLEQIQVDVRAAVIFLVIETLMKMGHSKTAHVLAGAWESLLSYSSQRTKLWCLCQDWNKATQRAAEENLHTSWIILGEAYAQAGNLDAALRIEKREWHSPRLRNAIMQGLFHQGHLKDVFAQQEPMPFKAYLVLLRDCIPQLPETSFDMQINIWRHILQLIMWWLPSADKKKIKQFVSEFLA
jgi:hypothetical protein